MNSGGASSHAPPPLAARGFTHSTRRRESNRETGQSRPASSPLSSYAGGRVTVTCNNQKKHTNGSRF